MITVDDLIIVNMMFKFKHGYESIFLVLKFMEFYILLRIVAILYQQDSNLKISSSNRYLTYTNCKLLIQGYENIINMSYGDYRRLLEIDLSTLKLKKVMK